jgi:benzodiazapine receptor
MIARYYSMAAFMLIVVMAAAVGGQFAAGEWYQELNKPDWIPPEWLYGPVWSVLYLLMALAMWHVWETRKVMRTGALIWWLIQIALNVAWSWLFFGLTRIGWALAEMTILIGVVVMCIQSFRFLSRPAALMMLPYLAWLVFAWWLNFTLWSMNRGGIGSLFS